MSLSTVVIIFTSILLCHIVEAYDAIGTKAINVDIEWVLQGKDIQFSGFFVEVLGISSELVTKFPHMRLTKSIFLGHNESISDPVEVSETLMNQLFPKEIENIKKLLSTTVINTTKKLDPLLFNDRVVDLPDDMCENNIEEYQNEIHVVGNQNFTFKFDSMSKSVVEGVTSKQVCCGYCRDEPLCLAWSMTKDAECLMKSRKIKTQVLAESVADPKPHIFTSVIKERTLIPPPRVIILHGTACACENMTMSPYQNLKSFKRDGNTILIGRYMLERGADRFSFDHAESQILHCAMLMDEVWVPSQWMANNLQRMAQQLNMPLPEVVVVPEAVDTTLFSAAVLHKSALSNTEDTSDTSIDEQSRECVVTSTFQFLSIFKWEHRKGWDILLRAYWTAFKSTDNVVLRLQTYNPVLTVQDHSNITHNIMQYAQEQFGKSLHELAEVRISDQPSGYTKNASEIISREGIRLLYAQSDAFVLPTRGEGYCLPAAEAMSMGLPVIITNHSGMTAYATDDNAYLIPIDETFKDPYGYVEPDFNALVSLLKKVHSHPSERAVKGREGQKTMAIITPASVVNIMTERVRILMGRRGWYDY